MAQCSECGYALSPADEVCPKCGCPVPQVNQSILHEGKGTEAEETISSYASFVLKWGNILNIVFLVINLIASIIFGAYVADINGSDGWLLGVPTILGIAIFAVIEFFVIKFLIKLFWAFIMLFVNISTTLKRIEINQENHVTC